MTATMIANGVRAKLTMYCIAQVPPTADDRS